MEKKLYSVALGPFVDGKPSKVQIVVARSFSQVADYFEDADCCTDALNIQLLPDTPIIL